MRIGGSISIISVDHDGHLRLHAKPHPSFDEWYAPRRTAIRKILRDVEESQPRLPEGQVLFDYGDTYGWDMAQPHLAFVKPPKASNVFLFPNQHFADWETTYADIASHSLPWSKRDPAVYFAGGDTSHARTNIRKLLYDIQEPPLHMHPPGHRRPRWEPASYRYALDLAGNMPWSVRLAELYAAACMPIRVTHIYSRWGPTASAPWIQWFEDYFGPKLLTCKEIRVDANYFKPFTHQRATAIQAAVHEARAACEAHPRLTDAAVKRNQALMGCLTHAIVAQYTAKQLRECMQAAK